MRLAYMILAESAAAIEGKLFVHGGGISRILAPALPWVEPQLAVAISLDLETGRDEGMHSIELQVLDPFDSLLVPPATGEFYLPPVEELAPGENWALTAALTLTPLPFNQAGAHTARLVVDQAVMGEKTFGVILAGPEPHGEAFDLTDTS